MVRRGEGVKRGMRRYIRDNVVVLELLQQTDFPDCRTRHAFVFGFQSNLLEGDNPVRIDIPSLVDNAICTWCEHLR